MRRRAVLAGGLLLGGCGFRPLYMPAGGGRGSVAAAELGAVYVPPIAERSGQFLRQALQRRLDGSGTGVAKKYELIASMEVSGETIGILRDSSTTRIRLNGAGPWTLRTLSLERTVLTSGRGRITDGVNIVNQQFFALDLESEAAQKRIAEALADQIIVQVAAFLRQRAEKPA